MPPLPLILTATIGVRMASTRSVVEAVAEDLMPFGNND